MRVTLSDSPLPPCHLPPTDAAVLETLLAKSPLGLAILDRDYRYLRVSESLAAMNGRTVAEHLGRHAREIVGDAYWDGHLGPLFERAMGGDEVLDQEVVGSPHWDPERVHHYRVSYYPLRVDGAVAGVGIVVHDVTPQQEAKAELEAAYEREHRIAEVLQRSLLRRPPKDAWPGLEVACLYKAAREEALVGGDFFDAFSLPDGRVALVVGDVSGKGLIAAERTAEVKYSLRAFLRDGEADPAAAVRRVNVALCRDADPASTGFAFVALLLAVLDPATGAGCVTVAGMEPPVLVRAGGGAYDILALPALPLGVDDGAEYGARAFRLEPGDLLLLATDGLTEARSAGSDLFGPEAVVTAAREASALDDLEEAGRSLLARAEAFAGGQLPDDACLLLARRPPTPP